MAMAPQGQPNSSATNRPSEPYSDAGNCARHVALYLTILLGVLGLAIVLQELYRRQRARGVHAGSGSGSGEQRTDRDSNADMSDPENPDAAAAAAQADEATNRREPNSCAGHYDVRYVAFFIVGALLMIALMFTLVDAAVRSSREGK